METMTQTIPFQAEQPIFNKVDNISELIHMTADERARYNISIDSYRTNLSAMKNERAEGVAGGMAKGMAKGRAEGRAEGDRSRQLSTARLLKAMRVLSVAQISEATGLSVEEIKEL